MTADIVDMEKDGETKEGFKLEHAAWFVEQGFITIYISLTGGPVQPETYMVMAFLLLEVS